MKKLYRSTEHRMISGVLGGFGEYFNTDPKLLRIAFLIFLLVTGFFPGVIIYFVAILIMSEAPFITPFTPAPADDHS